MDPAPSTAHRNELSFSIHKVAIPVTAVLYASFLAFSFVYTGSATSAVWVALLSVALVYTSLCFHELGHYTMLKYLNRPVTGLVFFGAGAALVHENDDLTPRQRFVVAAAGPAYSGYLLLLSLLLPTNVFSLSLVAANFLILALNLFPVAPLDGYKIWQPVLSKASFPGVFRVLLCFAGLLAVLEAAGLFIAVLAGFQLAALSLTGLSAASHSACRPTGTPTTILP